MGKSLNKILKKGIPIVLRRYIYRLRLRFGLGPLESCWVSSNNSLKIITTKNFKNSRNLDYLFKKYNSDKSLAHDYHIPYGQICELIPKGDILEIGIGSINPIFPGNMSSKGSPGASLYAWRDSGFFNNVLGADIDSKTLLNERFISTYYVDQNNTDSLEDLKNAISSKKISLVVDDGLHEAQANFRSLEVLFPIIMPGGFYIIEDLTRDLLHILLVWILRDSKYKDFSLWLNRGRFAESHLIAIQKV
jgi:hypothetical protein